MKSSIRRVGQWGSLVAVVSLGIAAEPNPATNSPGANLAVVAEPSASYVSGDTTLGALNDGVVPRRSRDSQHGSYGNWPRTGKQWVQYDWSQPISTKQIDVYWWIDGQGISAPKACSLLYWDGKEFQPVKNVVGLGV